MKIILYRETFKSYSIFLFIMYIYMYLHRILNCKFYKIRFNIKTFRPTALELIVYFYKTYIISLIDYL